MVALANVLRDETAEATNVTTNVTDVVRRVQNFETREVGL
jgi:hypothetical protein